MFCRRARRCCSVRVRRIVVAWGGTSRSCTPTLGHRSRALHMACASRPAAIPSIHPLRLEPCLLDGSLSRLWLLLTVSLARRGRPNWMTMPARRFWRAPLRLTHPRPYSMNPVHSASRHHHHTSAHGVSPCPTPLMRVSDVLPLPTCTHWAGPSAFPASFIVYVVL